MSGGHKNEEAKFKNDMARLLYWQGYKLSEIAEHLAWPYENIRSWKRTQKWDDASVIQKCTTALDARFSILILKPEKTDQDLNEIKALTHSIERFVRMDKFAKENGNTGDLNPKMKERNKRQKKKKDPANFLSSDDIKKLEESFFDENYEYQNELWHVKEQMRNKELPSRIRNILKSRQVGMTWYFAREALLDAAKTGYNKVFLSASKNQAHIFKKYIHSWVRDVTGVELSGESYILGNNQAEMMFLGTNYRTAQGFSGDFYLDEYFWIYGFDELKKVASAMATHKHWIKTYFSTPSTLKSEAYPFWSGDKYNKRNVKKGLSIDISHKALKDGVVCADRQWRKIITIEDAIAGGCDLFDIEELSEETTSEEFRNLYLCEFTDDTNSTFAFSELQACLVDSWEIWEDFNHTAYRPLGNRPVWIGYDPSRTRDLAALTVTAPPLVDGGKFRVVEKKSFKGMNFEEQAAEIQKMTQKYNVEYIGIDATGIGIGVYDLVKKFHPHVDKINYTVESKNELVLKAKSIISSGRLEFDAGWKDVVQSLLTIRKSVTASGKQVSYSSGRSDDAGHGDQAWSLLNSLNKLKLSDVITGTTGSRSIVETY